MTNLKIKKITIEKTKKEFSEFASSFISTEDYEKKLSDIAIQVDEFAKNKFIVSREKFGKIGQMVGEIIEYYDAKIVLDDFTNHNASIGMTFNADPDLLKTILESSLNSLNNCIEEQLRLLKKETIVDKLFQKVLNNPHTDTAEILSSPEKQDAIRQAWSELPELVKKFDLITSINKTPFNE